jgi:hypothetical protein
VSSGERLLSRGEELRKELCGSRRACGAKPEGTAYALFRLSTLDGQSCHLRLHIRSSSRSGRYKPATEARRRAAFRKGANGLLSKASQQNSTGTDADRFRYALLVFDLTTLAFIVATSFVPRNSIIEWLDVSFGLVILVDFCARLFISKHRLRDLLNPWTWADAIAIVSFLAPLVGEAAGFLRILRTL